MKQTRKKDIALFIELAKLERPKTQDDVPTYCLIPAFMISELKRAFEMGVIYIYSVYCYRYDCSKRLDGDGYDYFTANYDFSAV